MDRPERPGTEIRVAVVGPLVSLGLAAVFAAASRAVAAIGAPALLVAVLLRSPTGPGGLVVQPDGRAFGLVRGEDLDRAVELQALRTGVGQQRPRSG